MRDFGAGETPEAADAGGDHGFTSVEGVERRIQVAVRFFPPRACFGGRHMQCSKFYGGNAGGLDWRLEEQPFDFEDAPLFGTITN